MEIPALNRQRLADRIADILREQILLGDLQPGSNIPERETAAALGVSRTPLREALLILEGEGLVWMSPARSPLVANPSLDDVSQLLLVISALEALAGELACELMTDDELENIIELHREMNATPMAVDPTGVFAKDMAFHAAIVASTKNEALIKTHRQYNARLWRARFLASSRRQRRARTHDQHAQILAGLKARDGAATSAAMGLHLRSAIQNLTEIHAEEIESDGKK